MIVDPEHDTWSFDPELEPPPRKARLTTAAQVSRFVAVAVWLAATLGVFMLALRDMGQLKQLIAGGRQTQATVMGKYTGDFGSYSCYVWYEFPFGRYRFPDSIPVSLDEYEATRIPSPLTVTFLPADPTIHRVGVVDQVRMNQELSQWEWAIGLTSTFFAMYWAFVERRYRWRIFLLRHGIAVPATVTSTEARRISKSSYWVLYTYSIQGRPFFQQAAVNAMFFNSLFVGCQITILYHPANPRASLPYRTITEAFLLEPKAEDAATQ